MLEKGCSQPGCTTTFRDTGYWSHIRAADKGWFMQFNGNTWCPDHKPEWVDEWRAKKAAEKEAKAEVLAQRMAKLQ